MLFRSWVGASRSFGRSSAAGGYYFSRNAVQSHSIGYDFNYGFHPGGGNCVGFRFDSGAGYRYGFAEFNWDLASGTLTIPQWWYDDSGAAVQVVPKGAVPEPSALALLAMGAAGLAAYRANRKPRPEVEPAGDA